MEQAINHTTELREALQAAIDWIDAVPSDTVLPTMPGFDRDWVDDLLNKTIRSPLTNSTEEGHSADKDLDFAVAWRCKGISGQYIYRDKPCSSNEYEIGFFAESNPTWEPLFAIHSADKDFDFVSDDEIKAAFTKAYERSVEPQYDYDWRGFRRGYRAAEYKFSRLSIHSAYKGVDVELPPLPAPTAEAWGNSQDPRFDAYTARQMWQYAREAIRFAGLASSHPIQEQAEPLPTMSQFASKEDWQAAVNKIRYAISTDSCDGESEYADGVNAAVARHVEGIDAILSEAGLSPSIKESK